MLDRFRWQHGWSVFAVTIPIASVVILISLLTFAWGFDVETSPAWQLGVHYLMLALLLSMTFVMASYRLSGFGERFLGAMLLAAVLAPVAVFAAYWVVGGPYGGFRDPPHIRGSGHVRIIVRPHLGVRRLPAFLLHAGQESGSGLAP